MSNEQKPDPIAPSEIWLKGDLHPIRLTLVAGMPGNGSVSARYAIYFNHQTQEPVRIHLPNIQPVQLSKAEMFKAIHEHAISRLKIIEEAMQLEINARP